MTPIQRKACLSLRGLSYGRFGLGTHAFARAMVRRGEARAWPFIELSQRNLMRLARSVRRFRRQICDPHLLFLAQRTLAEANQEEPCRQP